jgi:hypothetical protein
MRGTRFCEQFEGHIDLPSTLCDNPPIIACLANSMAISIEVLVLPALLAIAAGWTDYRSRRIPNWLTVPGLVLVFEVVRVNERIPPRPLPAIRLNFRPFELTVPRTFAAFKMLYEEDSFPGCELGGQTCDDYQVAQEGVAHTNTLSASCQDSAGPSARTTMRRLQQQRTPGLAAAGKSPGRHYESPCREALQPVTADSCEGPL